LSHLIELGVGIGAVPVAGRWCEVDDESDLEVAELMVAAGMLDVR
jgi:hypothetical protein